MEMTDKCFSFLTGGRAEKRMWEDCVLKIRCLADYDKQGEAPWP